jgi:type VI secretion system protein ImpE
MTPGELFQQDKLSEAVQAALHAVRTDPTSRPKRWLLAELACFSGDLERADRQLEMLVSPDAKDLVAIGAFRQLVRAEQARRDFFEQGRPPEFLTPPPSSTQLLLQASIAIREKKYTEAMDFLAQAERERTPVSGTMDGVAFSDFRDLDDLTPSILEVLTSNGIYYWVSMNSVQSIQFETPAGLIDLLWLPVQLTMKGGAEGKVYLPTIYPSTDRDCDEQLQIGRITEWIGGEGTPVRGRGLREFLVGQEPKSILELKDIEFTES